MRNAGLDEAQAGVKITKRNINNLRYAGDTSLMADSEEIKGLLMKVKEEIEKVSFKTQHSESWDHGIWSHHLGKQWKEWQTLFWGAQKSLQMVTAAMKLKDAYSLEEKLWPSETAH